MVEKTNFRLRNSRDPYWDCAIFHTREELHDLRRRYGHRASFWLPGAAPDEHSFRCRLNDPRFIEVATRMDHLVMLVHQWPRAQPHGEDHWRYGIWLYDAFDGLSKDIGGPLPRNVIWFIDEAGIGYVWLRRPAALEREIARTGGGEAYKLESDVRLRGLDRHSETRGENILLPPDYGMPPRHKPDPNVFHVSRVSDVTPIEAWVPETDFSAVRYPFGFRDRGLLTFTEALDELDELPLSWAEYARKAAWNLA
jgi:hypothetical protein